MSDHTLPGTPVSDANAGGNTTVTTPEQQRTIRVEAAGDAMRDLMEALDKLAHEDGLARSQWLAEVREGLDGLTARYSDWTEQFLDDFAEEPPYVDPEPWECQPCGYRGATRESATSAEHHAGVVVFAPRTAPPAGAPI